MTSESARARDARRKARAASAEGLVAQLLLESGFAIVARNLRLGHLELDIVARRGDLVVVVEVRARDVRAFTTGFGSLGAEKRKRIRRAAERLWRRRYQRDASVTRLRIDAAAVHFGPEGVRVHYAKGAF